MPDLRLADAGQVTARNHARLGYQRLIRGVYGQLPDTSDLTPWRRREAEFLARVQAVVHTYQDKGVVLFGPTALQVWGVALPERWQDWQTCHIQVADTQTRPRRAGVDAHPTRHRVVASQWVDGLPLLHPVEHWLQLRGATEDELVEVGDGLLRRRHPLLTRDDMVTRLAELAGRPGVKRANRAMRLVVAGTDSLPETRVRLALVRAGLPTPEVNLPVFSPTMGTHFLLDMGYPAAKVGVEYDGAVHVGNRSQLESDAARRRVLQDEGWLLITATAADLRDLNTVVQSVQSALVLRGVARAR